MFLDVQKDFIIWLQGFHNALSDLFFNVVSFFGEPEFYILLLGLFYWIINKKAGELLGVSLGISISINNILKGFFNLARPFETYSDVENFREYSATGSSFPSGHAQGSTTVFYALANFYKKRSVWIFASVMLVLMMFSRMFLGVHYLQDVIVGSLLGVLIATGVYIVFNTLYVDQNKLHRIYLLIALLLLPFMVFINVNDFFRGFGIYVGIILAVMFEKQYVNFTHNIPLAKKILRYVLGVLAMMLTMIGVGELFALFGFDDGTFLANFLDFIRFFLIAFIGIGLYPWVYTKLNF